MPLWECFAKELEVSRVSNFSIDSKAVCPACTKCRKSITKCFSNRNTLPDRVIRKVQRLVRNDRLTRFINWKLWLDDKPLWVPELGESLLCIRCRQSLAVPAGYTGEERDTATLFGLREDCHRATGVRHSCRKRIVDGFNAVAINFDRMPTKSFDTGAIFGDVMAESRFAALSKLIDVDNRDEVVEAFL